MLKETDLRLGLTDIFGTTATRTTLDPATLQRRLLLCLYAYGTNAGIHRIAPGSWRIRERSPPRPPPLPHHRQRAAGDHRSRQRHPRRPPPAPVRPGDHNRVGLDEVRGVGPQPAHRMARPLPRTRRDDLLARRTQSP